MKRLIIIIFLPILSFGQAVQLYPDGVATDQDQNSFEWINYGEQDWAISNATIVTYRDGTPIPEAFDDASWASLTTGAWTYSSSGEYILYNWYAVMGIHDNDPDTPNKEFAPEGWHVPSYDEWQNLENYLTNNGYNDYNETCPNNSLAKAVSSTLWPSGGIDCSPGWDNENNNLSGFNAISTGSRRFNGVFEDESNGLARFWTSTEYEQLPENAWETDLSNSGDYLGEGYYNKNYGCAVRFVRNTSTASVNNFSNELFSISPNPVSESLLIQGNDINEIIIYSSIGKEVLRIIDQNKVNVSTLTKGIYLIQVTNGIDTSTKKFIKK